MTEKAWKACERKIAALLGGKRIPVTGRQRGDVPDIAHSWLSVEVKNRQTLPAWLLEALAQAEAAARDGQLPVAILHQSGQRHERSLIVLRLADFRAWFGDSEIAPLSALPISHRGSLAPVGGPLVGRP